MSMQIAQRVLFRPAQCPGCANFAQTVNRCRGYSVESAPNSLLAEFADETDESCARYSPASAIEEHSTEGSQPAMTVPPAQQETPLESNAIPPATIPVPAAAAVEIPIVPENLSVQRIEETSSSAPAVVRGIPRIHCPKCGAENEEHADHCQKCDAKLLPSEGVVARLVVFFSTLAVAVGLGYLVYFWYYLNPDAAPIIPFLEPISNPIALSLAAFIAFITAIVALLRRTPDYVKYRNRAARHEKLNPWQSLADLEHAMDLAPEKEQLNLLKQRMNLFEKLGFAEDAARDYLVLITNPDRFKGEADTVSLFLGGDSEVYTRTRRSGEIMMILDSGKARAVGYCPKCNLVVELNKDQRCPQHPKVKGQEVEYVIPADVLAGKLAVMQKLEGKKPRVADQVTELLATGQASAIGLCTRCNGVVELDSQRRCLIHPKAQVKKIQYAMSKDLGLARKRIFKSNSQNRLGRFRTVIYILAFLMIIYATIVLLDIDLATIFQR